MEGLAELAFRRHHAQIYRYLRRRTRDADRAEDLAQEVFADAAAALGTGDWQPASMLAWLHTIAQRRFADEARRRRYSRTASRSTTFSTTCRLLNTRGHCASPRRPALKAFAGSASHRCDEAPPRSSFCEICTRWASWSGREDALQRALAALRRDLEQQGIASYVSPAICSGSIGRCSSCYATSPASRGRGCDRRDAGRGCDVLGSRLGGAPADVVRPRGRARRHAISA